MSRTTLCLGTAAGVAAVTVVLMIARALALGSDLFDPHGHDTWRVSLVIQGKTSPTGRFSSPTPLETDHQHVLADSAKSEELDARPADQSKRREITWTAKPGTPAGAFRARAEFLVSFLPGSDKLQPPASGEWLGAEGGIDGDHPEIASLARRLCTGLTSYADQAAILFQFVDEEIANEPGVAASDRSAVECLRLESGPAVGKARLLAALLRARGIPARLVSGLPLAKAEQQPMHWWVESWLGERWLALDPFYRLMGRLPRYLVFGYGDRKPVHGQDVTIREFAFLVEKRLDDPTQQNASLMHRLFTATSLSALPPAERHLAEFLLLVPMAALIVCVFRTLVGLATFGTFAPAILGLAFRELQCVPGLMIFVTILLAGWLARRWVDRYHLLQVPRTAVLLSVVVLMLVAFIAFGRSMGVAVTRYVSLFPMVILTGMIERFWTLEEEDGTKASFQTLLSTMLVAGCVSLVASLHFLTAFLFAFPEAMLLVVAGQLLLGRYTGYRLTELWRFRELLAHEAADAYPRIYAGKASVGRGRI